MTVIYQNSLGDTWHQFAYLATMTVSGRLISAFILLLPVAGPALFFFSTPPGSQAEHFAAMAFLPALGATYALLAFITLPSFYLSVRLTPPITVTIDHAHCRMINLFRLNTPWRGFQRMVEEPKFFCFLGWRCMVYIPKHAFASRTEADRYFHTALTYWHEAKGTIPPPLTAPPDPSGVWPPAPQAADLQEPGAMGKH